MTESTEPTRRKRAKATTDIGRQLLQKERQRLAKEQAVIAEQLLNEAAAARAAGQQAANRPAEVSKAVAIQRSVVRNTAGVLASESVVVPIHCDRARYGGVSAWTDFGSIHVDYQEHDDPRVTVAAIRGMLYHEGGHCRFSIPFPTLRSMVGSPPIPEGLAVGQVQGAWNMLEDQRMETAVVTDSPRKAAYFTPMVLTILCPTPEHAQANYPILIWRRYLPKHVRRGARAAFVAEHGEPFTRNIEAIVSRYVRATTPEAMYEAVIAFAIASTQFHGVGGVDNHGPQSRGGITEEEARKRQVIIIDPNMEAEDDDEGEAIEIGPDDIVIVLPKAEQADDEDDDDEGDDEAEGQPVPGGSKGGESDDDEAGAAGAGESDDDDDDDDGAWDEHQDDEQYRDDEGSKGDAQDGPPAKGAGSDSGAHTEGQDGEAEGHDALDQSDLDEAIAQAEADRDADASVDADAAAYEDALSGEGIASNLVPYSYGIETNGDTIAVADALAREIEESFLSATMDKAPAWVEAQRRGIVNVLRYETRQPGDHDFFRAYMDSDLPGSNIAVSVLLDYSGSMGHAVKNLAQAGYACKAACDRLDIPCTVVLWDTDARVLWDANETAEVVPTISSNGGTEPTVALADLDNQRYGKEKHLVLIMTDGEWTGDWAGGYKRGRSTGSKRTLAAHKDEGRTIIGFGYGSDHLANGLRAKGCDTAYAIKDLMEIPRRLEQTLIDLA